MLTEEFSYLDSRSSENSAETMYKNVLTRILSLEGENIPNRVNTYMDDLNITEYQVIEQEVFELPDLTIFALNVVLVLEEKRPAYMASVLGGIADRIIGQDRELMSVPVVPTEPLLMLKKNLRAIGKQLCIEGEVTQNKMDITLGKILDYPYTGEDWSGTLPCLRVSYNVGELSLYCFNVPINKYTEAIRSKILEDLKKYQDTLKSYGYEVTLSVWSRSNEEEFLLDCLPAA